MICTTIDISDSNQPKSRWAVVAADDKGKPLHLGQVYQDSEVFWSAEDLVEPAGVNKVHDQ